MRLLKKFAIFSINKILFPVLLVNIVPSVVLKTFLFPTSLPASMVRKHLTLGILNIITVSIPKTVVKQVSALSVVCVRKYAHSI